MAQNEFRNALQAMSNSAASTVSAPVDGIAWLLRKAGLNIPGNALGGSDWMAQQGLTAPVRPGASQIAGDTLGLLAPMVAAAKAPQIARGLLSLDDKAMDMARVGVQNYMHGSGLAPTATVVAPNRTDENHLSRVMKEMNELGPPDIRAVWDEGQGVWRALEGSHRLKAAKMLGMEPRINEVPMKSWLHNHDLAELKEKISVARAARYLEDSNVFLDFPDLPAGGR